MDNSKGDVVIQGNVSRIIRYVFDCLSNSFETREGKWEGRLTAFGNELSKQINAAGSRPATECSLPDKERKKEKSPGIFVSCVRWATNNPLD